MPTLSNLVGRRANAGDVVRLEQGRAFRRIDSISGQSLIENSLNVCGDHADSLVTSKEILKTAKCFFGFGAAAY
jgi:hypothetical protein